MIIDGDMTIIDRIEDRGGDFEAIDLASAYWQRGDHAEALHHLEKGLGDMFPGLGELPEVVIAKHLDSNIAREQSKFKESMRQTEASIRRGARRSDHRFKLTDTPSAEGHQNQQEAWSGEPATGKQS